MSENPPRDPVGSDAVGSDTASGTARPRYRNGPAWVALGLAAALVLGVGGTLLLGGRTDAGDAVASAAEDLGGWEGITYRGQAGPAGRNAFDLTVTVDRDGDMAGVLTRDGGGRAEFARVGGVDLFRADARWWRGDAQRERKTRQLAGTWVRNPGPEIRDIDPPSLRSPSALAAQLSGPGPDTGSVPAYRDAGTRVVDGVGGRVVENVVLPEVVVSDDSTSRLLSIRPPAGNPGSPLRVSRAAPAELAAVGAAGRVRDEAVDYAATLYAKPQVELDWQPAGPCSTPTCSLGIRVRNTSPFDVARGSLTVTADGRSAGFHFFTLQPGGSEVFTARAANTVYARAGAQARILWDAQLTVY